MEGATSAPVTTEAFFKTHLIDAEGSEESAGSRCPVCVVDWDPTATEKPQKLMRITACGHHVHENCMVFWATSQDDKKDKCPECLVQLFRHDRLVLWNYAKAHGIEVEPEPLLEGEITEFDTIISTEEDLFVVELKAIRTVVSSNIDEALAVAEQTRTPANLVTAFEKTIRKLDTLGMPYSKYLNNKDQGSERYWEWKAGVAGHMLDQIEKQKPELRTSEEMAALREVRNKIFDDMLRFHSQIDG